MARLTLLHINIIGIVTILLLALILFFLLIKPKNDDIETTTSQYNSTVSGHGTEADVATNTKNLKKTKEAAKQTDADWKVESAYYMPILPYTDKSDIMQTYFLTPIGKTGSVERLGMRDLPTVYGRWITAWYDAQGKTVTRLPGTEFPIDGFMADPNAINGIKDHLTFPGDGKAWPVSLECKSFDDAMAHLRKFNGIQRHGMPVVSNVALQGQSPNLLLTYQVAFYIIPGTPPPPVDPRIGASKGNAGGMGGMMGGMGMMGGSMPPGMMGSSMSPGMSGVKTGGMSAGAPAPPGGGKRGGKDD
jgi:hypothetical protein